MMMARGRSVLFRAHRQSNDSWKDLADAPSSESRSDFGVLLRFDMSTQAMPMKIRLHFGRTLAVPC